MVMAMMCPQQFHDALKNRVWRCPCQGWSLRVESSGRAGLGSITNYECGETQWQNHRQHENDPCRATRKIDRVPDADALFDKERRIVRIEIEKPKLPT